MGKNLGTKFVFYAHPEVLSVLKLVYARHLIDADFYEFTNWDNFIEVKRAMQENDALVLVMSRPGLSFLFPAYGLCPYLIL